jgi:hypothetical protein
LQNDHLKSICYPCKDQIVTFYKYKEKVRVSLEDSKTNEIVAVVKEFIDQSSENLIVVRNENVLSLVPESQIEGYTDSQTKMVSHDVMHHEDIYSVKEEFDENERLLESSKEHFVAETVGNNSTIETSVEQKRHRRPRRYGRHKHKYTRQEDTET